VTIGKQANDKALNEVLLTNDTPVDLSEQGLQECPSFLDGRV
jgi:hypothetical protein